MPQPRCQAARKRGRPPGSNIRGENRGGLDASRLDDAVVLPADSRRARPEVERYTDTGPSTRLKDCAGNALDDPGSDHDSSSDEDAADVVPPRDRNPNHKKSGKRASKVEAAAKRAKERAHRIQALVDQGDEVFIDFSWEDRRKIALSSFTQALSVGRSVTDAHDLAAFAARVSARTSER